MLKIRVVKAMLRVTAAAAISLLVAFSASAQTVRYVHTDGLGSVVLTTDKDRNIVERSEYEPYGSLLNRPLTDGPGYTGHVMDATTGLTYMQQRYYDQSIGRFLSSDPISAISADASFNRYRYANNNPYKFTDPDGRNAVVLEVGIPLVILATAYYVVMPHEQRERVAAELDRATDRVLELFNKSESAADNGEGDKGASGGNSNPYDGPVAEPVTVVDGDGNAIPVETGEQLQGSPDGKYQQVIGKDGKPTGTRLDKGGHKNQADAKAKAPHGHRPGVTHDGNHHLPLNEPKPK